MESFIDPAFVELSSHLADRRQAILDAWRNRASADPEQSTARMLTRGQFENHIPPLLEALEAKLREMGDGHKSAAIDENDARKEEIRHGVERWQQGYRLAELMHEWGHLHQCLFDEIESFAANRPNLPHRVLAAAHQELNKLIRDGIDESACQYNRMQQTEAANRLNDMKTGMAKLGEIEKARGALIYHAVHDLRANVQSVGLAAEALRENTGEADRVLFATLVQEGVHIVSAMLEELMQLARLEAGQEVIQLTTVNAAEVIGELYGQAKPMADSRHLFMHTEGPADMLVQTDPPKLRRILQNLVFNALKYTDQGGVTVRWGPDGEHWWIVVHDTGPGLPAPSATMKPSARGGEGVGLSIVKRLSELLEATMEQSSSEKDGTSFRLILPRDYKHAEAKSKSKSGE
ncbi:MAG TPA: sensor histidine kinase [Candidatus Didemnitutus sp.]|nr:sensor histidine kinase [Candidatus Didemnitutus sp.]